MCTRIKVYDEHTPISKKWANKNVLYQYLLHLLRHSKKSTHNVAKCHPRNISITYLFHSIQEFVFLNLPATSMLAECYVLIVLLIVMSPLWGHTYVATKHLNTGMTPANFLEWWYISKIDFKWFCPMAIPLNFFARKEAFGPSTLNVSTFHIKILAKSLFISCP